MTRDERGMSSSLQLSLLFPVAISVFLLTLQWALFAWAEATASAAAEDGARTAAVLGGSEALGYETAVAAADSDGLSAVTAHVRRGADTTTATVTGEALAVIPLFPTTVQATEHVPTERITQS